MRKIRYGFMVLSMLLCLAISAAAEVRIGIGIGLPNVSIGINLPFYPQLVPVPGYPVYYAPRLNANYFFYDGMYWVYQDDNWYASNWYNGPWWFVESVGVPLFILRIPVRYYRQPPVYFRGWSMNAPPRWHHHWGHEWEQQRRGWDQWQRSSTPERAPLPAYQRKYSEEKYPRQVEQQHELHRQQYPYQPHETVTNEHLQQRLEQREPMPAQLERQEEPRRINPRRQETQRLTPLQQGIPAAPPPQFKPQGDENIQRSAPGQKQPQQPENVQPEQREPRSQEHQQKIKEDGRDWRRNN